MWVKNCCILLALGIVRATFPWCAKGFSASFRFHFLGLLEASDAVTSTTEDEKLHTSLSSTPAVISTGLLLSDLSAVFAVHFCSTNPLQRILKLVPERIKTTDTFVDELV